ncbi:ABC transporter permease [Streptococcus equi]|uniref:ABC transporter permease n=1 Tax=Streptococcus equi TaxID=1336 RepID=UPI001E5F330B|nr:ABC transporter permease [Streptococcus equi]MCD3368366.1 ABC transporter permease [Streptococcus equi subsp. zooepidemicus]HEL0623494.1 ABC transporter permease [Streptococcus equi subsp. zooepidemicus]HEL0674767.1 ABC transporter permease [Streptococcus equi subsp. zooepidemicus]HEL1119944.1 ABC transporter permease [Streptococcus equi subsp. zooepidemicus]
MINYLKSEKIKWKGSHAFYLILVLSLLQLMTIPPYMMVVKNPLIVETIPFFPMLGYPVLVVIVSILVHEQEDKANHFQNIRGEKNSAILWGVKLVVTDLLLLLPTLPLWLAVGIALKHVSYYTFIGIVNWLLLILLNHLHMLLSLLVGKGGNLLVAFVESLLILFATNKVFLNIFWLPVALPVNAIIEYNSESIKVYLLVLLVDIVVLFLMNLLILAKQKYGNDVNKI